MTFLINAANAALYADEIEQIQALRFEVLVKDLKWEGLTSAGGLESDRFDGPNAIYIGIREGDEVVAAIRLNKADRPTLTSEIFPHLVQFQALPAGERVFDVTRLVVSPGRGKTFRKNRYSFDLLCAAMEFGLAGELDCFTAVMPTRFFELLQHTGSGIYPLGFPVGIGSDEHLAVFIPVVPRTLDCLYRFTGNNEPRLLSLQGAPLSAREAISALSA